MPRVLPESRQLLPKQNPTAFRLSLAQPKLHFRSISNPTRFSSPFFAPIIPKMPVQCTAGYSKVAVDAARAAGSVIAKAFHAPKSVEHKGTVDLVTETDKECERLILKAITTNFPTHKFIGEEGSAAQGFTDGLTDDPTWMVDPLDGTTNFVHRWPFSCVSIALLINKEPVVGVVYNPVLDEMFTAEKGKGAFLNDQKIQVSDSEELSSALIATELGVNRNQETVDAVFDRIRNLSQQCRSLRCNGSCALNLCSVACGRLDAYYEIGLGGCWDMAAGALVLAEAGGKVLDPAGGALDVMSRRVLGTNAHLDKLVSDVLASSKLGSEEPAPTS